MVRFRQCVSSIVRATSASSRGHLAEHQEADRSEDGLENPSENNQQSADQQECIHLDHLRRL